MCVVSSHIQQSDPNKALSNKKNLFLSTKTLYVQGTKLLGYVLGNLSTLLGLVTKIPVRFREKRYFLKLMGLKYP